MSTTKCNLLPNGPTTTYFPSVSLQRYTDVSSCLELIVSPEDMQDCPLPNGYKPLLLPKIVHTENSIVDYPFSAYLVGADLEDYFIAQQTESVTNVIRDFVSEHHLTSPDESNGFLLPIDNDEKPSFTVSFDFQILSTDEKSAILLFKLDSTEITWQKPEEKTRCVIVFLSKKRHIRVYTNKNCHTFTDVLQDEITTKQNVHILPGIAAEINNVALWKYVLSEEHIRRLFTYGLFFIANDYQQLKQYRKQNNTISFPKNQHAFTNKSLLLFDETFTEELWEQKKEQTDNDQSPYIKSHDDADYSTVQLIGNKTYLVLDKTSEEWFEYTLILDISIPQPPIATEKLTVIKLNPQCEMYVAHNGKLCLIYDGKGYRSNSTIIFNEYFRLCISAQRHSIDVYFNNQLEISIKNNKYQFEIVSNRIDLFRETILILNTSNEDTVRVLLKSITYLNRSITIDELQSSALDASPFAIIGPSLMAMGYKKSWIESVIKQNKTTHISTIHRILREQKQDFIKADLANERKHYEAISARLNPSIDTSNSSEFDTNELITNTTQHLLLYWNSSHASKQPIDESTLDVKFDTEWLSHSTHDLDIRHDVTRWIRDKASMAEVSTNINRLLDLDQSEQDPLTTRKSLHYSHQNISSKQYLDSRIAAEHGLTTIYARHTILNMLKIWSNDESTLFPFENFADYTFLVKLLKQLDQTERDKNEKIDRVHLLIYSILKTEIKQLVEHTDAMNNDILQSKAPLLYHLQKDTIIQSIQFLFKPSLFNQNFNGEILVNEQQPNWSFILKILNLLRELITDKSILTQQQIDFMITILFPMPIINLIFNLFLFVPTLSSKIFILHLFTVLIQTSNRFQLPNEIEQYFIQLLIELFNAIEKNDQSRNKFCIAFIDLVFVLLAKQKPNDNQKQEILSKLPDDIRDLFTTMNTIAAWNDQTSLPETFLEESDEVLGDKLKLNHDDLKKCNSHFNPNADQELINFINNKVLSKESLTNFIQSLPTESEPNSTFYKVFPILSNIPADCIQIRVRFICLLNAFVNRCLSMIDLSLAPEQSNLTDEIRTIKFYIMPGFKFTLFNEALRQTKLCSVTKPPSVYFDTVNTSGDNENTMFHQAYQQLHTTAHVLFRQSLEQFWLSQYVDMHSTDAGGPYRDSITRMCSDICSTRLPLFILCPNGRTNSGSNRDCWIPNVFPFNKSLPNEIIKQYRFIGQLMGMAISMRHYLDLKFPRLLWKRLLREEISIGDIEAVDIQSFSFLIEMEKNIEQIQLIEADEDIDSILSSIMNELHFDVVSSSGQTYELIPGGEEILITAKNFKQYCSLYRQYRLNEFHRQIDCIRQGIESIIPCFYLSLFTANQLEECVCGESQIDVEFLKRNTYYRGGYDENSPPIQRFWTVFGEMFNNDQRKLFLIFVWGRNTLPTQDEDFTNKFQINTFDVFENNVDKTLPRSHTCYFILDLPAYSTTEIMYERLNYAITSCPSIDGDGIEIDRPNTEVLDNNET